MKFYRVYNTGQIKDILRNIPMTSVLITGRGSFIYNRTGPNRYMIHIQLYRYFYKEFTKDTVNVDSALVL